VKTEESTTERILWNDKITLIGASTLSGIVNFDFHALSTLANGKYTLLNSSGGLGGGYTLSGTNKYTGGTVVNEAGCGVRYVAAEEIVD